MVVLSDACPNAVRASVLRAYGNERLKKSLIHILERCADAGYAASSLFERIEPLNSSGKFSGFLHVLHDRLLHAINEGDKNQIADLLAAADELNYEAGAIRIFGWYLDGPNIAWQQYYYDASDQSFLKTYGVHFDGQNPSVEELEASRCALARTFEVLNEIDPDAYEEMQSYVSDFAIFRSPSMNAATSMASLGIIRLSQLRPGQNWTRYLENVVHEVGHHHLNFLMMQDPLILNEGEQLFRSPLRREARPLSGIYHAMFVLGRSMRMIRRFERSSFLNPDNKVVSSYNNAQNPASFEEKFDDCWQVLHDNAKLTELGGCLMQSVRDMAFE